MTVTSKFPASMRPRPTTAEFTQLDIEMSYIDDQFVPIRKFGG
jgi:hypothetical protein